MRNLLERLWAAICAVVGFLSRVLPMPLGVVGLVWLSINASSLIVVILDGNLAAIKFATSLIPAPYGAMGEVALRGLGADRALIFAEGTFAVKLAFWLIARLFKRAPSQSVNQKEMSK